MSYTYSWGLWWSWSYGSWIYNYLCNQCLSSLVLWVQIPLRRGVVDTTLCDKVCQWLATGQWVSPGTPFSSTNEYNWPPQYNWNIVESGVKHPNPYNRSKLNFHETYIIISHFYSFKRYFIQSILPFNVCNDGTFMQQQQKNNYMY